MMLAWLSSTRSEQMGAQTFQNNHWPEARSWNETWKSLGFHPDPSFKNSTIDPPPLASSVLSFDLQVRADGCALHIERSPFQTGPESWSRTQCPVHGTWKTMGKGLVGFENSIHFVENIDKTAKKTANQKAIWIDPKEIRY
jgi:hypothetical protein